MEDRVNKPKRKKCSGSGKLSIPRDHMAFGGVHHHCPDCNCCVEITAKGYTNPRTVRQHMVNVKLENAT